MRWSKLKSILWGIPVSIVILSGCAGSSGKAIELTLDSVTLKEGETTVVYAMTDDTGEVTWVSSDESIATVTSGEILGKKEGNVTITASIGNAEAKCQVAVVRDESDATYLESAETGYYIELDNAEGIQTAFVLHTTDPNGADIETTPTDLTYEMYNKKIASIDEKGVITPLEIGPTTLTVSSGDVSCTVDVVVSTKLIRTPQEWLEVLKLTDNLSGYYYLINNLDFGGLSYSGLGTSAEKEAAKCFRGTIDGGNHSISNITVSNGGGIFGPLMDAKIKNLAFTNVTLTSGGGGIAPAITGNGTEFKNISIDFSYKGGASGSTVLAREIEGCGSLKECLITVKSPSGNTARDGISIAGSVSGDFTMKNAAVVCQEKVPDGVPAGMQVFSNRMEAIWTVNSGKMLGSDWTYSTTELPVLGRQQEQ